MRPARIFEFEQDGRLLPRGEDLTDEQLAALDLDRHIVVTAGAGSGKTRTLSRRVLRILGEFAWQAATGTPGDRSLGPRNVLVTTFTERAAAELQERIRDELLRGIRELQGRIDELEADPRLQPGVATSVLEHLRSSHRKLDEARIGTFHGFCAASLREFSAALGLDPGFAILQGPDHKRLLSAVVEDTLNATETLSGDGGTHRGEGSGGATSVFRAFGRRDLADLLESWVQRRAELQPLREVLQQHSDEQLIERWLLCYAQTDLGALEAAIAPDSVVHDALLSIHELSTLYTGPVGSCPPLLLAAREALAVSGQPPPAGTAARSGRLAHYLGLFLTDSGALRKTHHGWNGKKSDFGKDRPGRAADLWRPLRQQLAELFGEQGELLATIPGRADEIGLPILRALAALGSEAVRRFQGAKEREALLDFTDLEIEMLRLLREHPHERARLQRRFAHQLIDEFQDTNATQWSIVKLLAGDPLPPSGMFLVGDPKQAIYRFRGGDVTLFDRAIDELKEAGGRVLNFSANFRSRSALIDTFNHLFDWLMPGDEPDRLPWEAPFEALEAGRRAEPGDDDPGAVEMLWLEPDDATGTSTDETADTPMSMASNPLLAAAMPLGREAALVATRLRDHHLPAVTAHKGIKAAILLRRRSHLPAYAFALRQAGVAHVVARGRGFFARQEVLDVANLLLALAHPDDVIALIGALRGPFLGLEDAWLLWLAHLGSASGHRAVRRGWDHCCRGVDDPQAEMPAGWSELPPEAHLALGAAASQFNRWRQLRYRLPLSAFLRDVLFTSGAFHLFSLGDPTGQARANVEKLLSLAAGYDARGSEGLADFALFLREQEEQQTDEGEASIDATAPVVIMTIHQSKGLEFPIVVLPDLQQALCRTETSALACSRLGQRWQGDDLWEVGLRVPVEEGERTIQPMVLRSLIQRRGRAEDLAESRRLLYVAMTRARDRLVCVSRAPQKASQRPRGLDRSTTWEEWLRSWLAAGGDQIVSVSANVRVASEHALAAPDPASGPSVMPSAEDLAPLARSTVQVITPHSLATTSAAASPTAGAKAAAMSNTALLGKMRGLLVHGCLEDGLYEPSDATERRIAELLARAGLPHEEHAPWLRGQLKQHLDGFRQAAPPPLFNSDQSAVFRELPFRLPLPEAGGGQGAGDDAGAGKDAAPVGVGWLEGIVDLVYRDEELQRWVVVDYKSDKADPELLVEKYADQLLAYCWAVATILPELADPHWTVEARLLCTAHGQQRTGLAAATRAELDVAFRALLEERSGHASAP
jgi:ATP-dependent helicase/nuclease subunit A